MYGEDVYLEDYLEKKRAEEKKNLLNLNEIKITSKVFEIKEDNSNKKYNFFFQTIVENNKTRKY